MPRYVYRCPIHGERERTLPVADRNRIQRCTEAVGPFWEGITGAMVSCMEVMKRVPTTAAVHFKGSGFYETDYKGKS